MTQQVKAPKPDNPIPGTYAVEGEMRPATHNPQINKYFIF